MPANPADTPLLCTCCGEPVTRPSMAGWGICGLCDTGLCGGERAHSYWLSRISAAACPKPSLHTVEGAPIQKLADLLRTATEFVEMVDSSSAYTDADVALFDALRAAVHALNEPLAPSRLADAHAAPATGGAP